MILHDQAILRLLLLCTATLYSPAASSAGLADAENASSPSEPPLVAHFNGIGLVSQASAALDPASSWAGAAGLPGLHARGLQGRGQVLGLGDTGVDTGHCAFTDSTIAVPFDVVSTTHRKIQSYITALGDRGDGPDGHGTHIAGIMVGADPAPGPGVAPAARLVMLDLEDSRSPGKYNIPDKDIGTSYFDRLRSAGASVACSPWSFPSYDALEVQVDRYLWQHPDFLAVFPSGNSFDPAAQQPQSPCRAKNVLCVGASFNAREAYLQQPSFVESVVRLASTGREIAALPAFFGPTVPLQRSACTTELANLCLQTQSACPECAYDPQVLGSVSGAPVALASPQDGCQTLASLPIGAACLVYRGNCKFAVKVANCAKAGASGVVVVNTAGAAALLMVNDTDAAQALTIPAVLVSAADAADLLATGQRVSFPLLAASLSPFSRAPYSSFGPLPSGRAKPELVFPGDNVVSAAVGTACGTEQMSGTSQSCGAGAATAGLARQYLQEYADPWLAQLQNPLAATIKALLAAIARPADDAATLTGEVGFGFPALGAMLPWSTGVASGAPPLAVIQSQTQPGRSQRYCLSVGGKAATAGLAGRAAALQVALAWTDPPDPQGRLVNDLNLAVACEGDGWKQRLGNAGPGSAAADSVNTIEKVLVSDVPTQAAVTCIVTVTLAAAAVQDFSLALAGPFALAPGCESQAPPPSCGPHGVATTAAGGAKPACVCDRPWMGPLCDQQAVEAPARGAPVTTSAPPWQWAFLRAPTCGPGTYQFALDGPTGPERPLLSVSASPTPQLWGSQPLVLPNGTWQDAGGVRFSAPAVDADTASTGVSWIVDAEVLAPGGNGTSSGGSADALYIYFAAFNRGRDGSASFTLRPLAGPGACAPDPTGTTPRLRGTLNDRLGAASSATGPCRLHFIACAFWLCCNLLAGLSSAWP